MWFTCCYNQYGKLPQKLIRNTKQKLFKIRYKQIKIDIMKNKLQSIIKHIKTMFYNLKFCVSLKKDNTTTEKDLCEKENCGKFGKLIRKKMRNIRFKIINKSNIKKYDDGFTKVEILEIFKNSFNETIKNREKQKDGNKKVGAL